jgi:hypothetical protein
MFTIIINNIIGLIVEIKIDRERKKDSLQIECTPVVLAVLSMQFETQRGIYYRKQKCIRKSD